MTLTGLVTRNLVRAKLRLALTLFAIFVAFFLFTVLQTVKASFDAGIDFAGADRLVVNNKINFTQPLPIAYVNRIKTVEGVADVTHQSWFGAYYQSQANQMFGFYVEPDSYLRVYDEYLMPDDQKEAWLANQRGLLVGRDIADEYGFQVGQQVAIFSNIFTQENGASSWDFIVEGIYDVDSQQQAANTILLHYDYFNESASNARDFIGSAIVTTASPDINDQVAQAIDAQFINSRFETETITEAAFTRAFIEQLGNIALIITSVIGAAFVTILMIVGNTMVLAIRERAGETAVLKTLGFKAGTIFGLVLSESFAIAMIGGLAGLGVAAFVISGLSSSGIAFGSPLVLTLEIALQALGLMALLGLITGLIPAVTAQRQPIVRAFAKA